MARKNLTMRNTDTKKWLLPVILAAVTLVTSAVLMLTHELTKERIEQQKLQNTLNSLKRLMPSDLIDNDVLTDALTIYEPERLGHRQPKQLYLGTQRGQLTVLAIPVVARNGYAGDIELLVGVKVNGNVTDVAIINHKETPGLGDIIERRKSDWLQQFPDTSLNQPLEKDWKVKKDGGYFDQITAATITPRAVVSAIKTALLYQQAEQSKWSTQTESGNE